MVFRTLTGDDRPIVRALDYALRLHRASMLHGIGCRVQNAPLPGRPPFFRRGDVTKKYPSSRALVLAVLLVIVALAFYACAPKSEAQTGLKLEVNDISVLWPVPITKADVDQLINGKAVWPKASFEAVIKMAPEVRVKDGFGNEKKIGFPPEWNFDDRATWKLVGFRVDPSAPSTDEASIKKIGSIPQIRLIMQPVTMSSNVVIVHDYTAHLAYDYVLPSSPPLRPDREKFAEILDDLRKLKAFLKAANPPVSTQGELGVNPGLAQNVPGFSRMVAAFLGKHLAKGSLNFVAFMGVPAKLPEPWIFFKMKTGRTVKPEGEMFDSKTTGGDGSVTPVPKNSNLVEPKPPIGVSTAMLFGQKAPKLDQPAIADRAEPLFRDIPDIIANPMLSNVLNTDCFSCHSETTRRSFFNLEKLRTKYQFKLPEGIPGVKPSMLPDASQTIISYNVRNFGWFQKPATKEAKPVITMRTANETANALAFIRREYSR